MSYHIREPEDVPGAVELFRMSYERAKAAVDDINLVGPRKSGWGNGSSALHSAGLKVSKKRLYRKATRWRSEAQRNVVER